MKTHLSNCPQPLGAFLLAGSLAMPAMPALAQNSAGQAPLETTLKPVLVRDQAEPSGKDSLRSKSTSIGKGQQELRDIPQSVTVVTEKLIDDRNLDNFKDVLHNTAGITFLAAEGGEEDIRLRGFSLATTGDIFLDGMRDPAFYDRDTFNNERIEVIRGSASMLFGRGSTGGAANQVSKQARAIDEHEISSTLGSGQHHRVTGDFNWQTGLDQGFRLNLMRTQTQNDGKGSGIEKTGVGANYRFGIGTKDEVSISGYWLDNKNPHMNYGLPWARYAGQTQGSNTLLPGLSPRAYYGLVSDYNAGSAKIFTAAYTHRFDANNEIKTQIRRGFYERDQRASAIRFATTGQTLDNFSDSTSLTRGTNLKIQNMDIMQAQLDASSKFKAWGMNHHVMAGIDVSRENREVFAARTASQGGVDLIKSTTTVGNPNDGASVNESSRVLYQSNGFQARNFGAYVQDMLQIAPQWKLLAGLRYDRLDGNYAAYTLPAAAPSPVTTTPFAQKISDTSKRLGALWQPDERRSFHISYGTSFNTSGDTYSYNATNVNVAPEQSRNFELGAKIDSQDKRFTTRYALFYAQKFNERNTDPLSAANTALLSGKRHAAGLEFDISGRITQKWEIFGSYAWIPSAKVDEAAPCPATGACTQSGGGSRPGDRPGLTPKHSGTIWNTYQIDQKWRVGAGVNVRSQQAPADVGTPAAGIYYAPGYATADLMAEYRFNDSYLVKANLNNIADKYYADSLYRAHYIPGAGRTLQVSLNARF